MNRNITSHIHDVMNEGFQKRPVGDVDLRPRISVRLPVISNDESLGAEKEIENSVPRSEGVTKFHCVLISGFLL